MNRLGGRMLSSWQPVRAFRPNFHCHKLLSSFPPAQAGHSSQDKNIVEPQNGYCRSATASATASKQSLSAWQLNFWKCRHTWKRAGINTLRCLVGCTLGDFSALWMLQTFYPGLGMGTIMAASMASGISTSIILETVLLRRGADQLSWPMALRTAMGMSMVSMLAMEAAENVVDYHLTGGVVALDDPSFWMAAAVSMTAGYLAPLPYNYLRLKKYGKACH
ncbi:hypothetical protein BDV27DRAFT_129426 [Aspergillus caelatus]|uniref:DUF4396 domain-containing protein n=1 Tax=Aspergillus caelatus TaxID=61420 RepID=A0A5N7A3R6_9EURO|nr:uncharacterized protein BDV27DRAFT_129426 [Aspergillus caelatus]KAE8363826.1 hypothetical protein BDV27DRAFT_129426 [Aspergillus caelatus]